ncbi:MAG: transcriptional repressor LexA [Planctomycetota bacterium]
MFLTKRQYDIVRFIKDYRRENVISPTLEEMATHFEVSKITIYEHLKQLEKKQVIRKSKHQARSIEVLMDPDAQAESRSELKIMGTIAAGRPVDVVAEPDSFDLADLVPPGGNCYLLRVQGSSMIDEQIRDGDLVLVENRNSAYNGEIVVAVTSDEETTLKKFYLEGDRVRLQPANAEMQPLHLPLGEVEIRGIVRAVIRQV